MYLPGRWESLMVIRTYHDSCHLQTYIYIPSYHKSHPAFGVRKAVWISSLLLLITFGLTFVKLGKKERVAEAQQKEEEAMAKETVMVETEQVLVG